MEFANTLFHLRQFRKRPHQSQHWALSYTHLLKLEKWQKNDTFQTNLNLFFIKNIRFKTSNIAILVKTHKNALKLGQIFQIYQPFSILAPAAQAEQVARSPVLRPVWLFCVTEVEMIYYMVEAPVLPPQFLSKCSRVPKSPNISFLTIDSSTFFDRGSQNCEVLPLEIRTCVYLYKQN